MGDGDDLVSGDEGEEEDEEEEEEDEEEEEEQEADPQEHEELVDVHQTSKIGSAEISAGRKTNLDAEVLVADRASTPAADLEDAAEDSEVEGSAASGLRGVCERIVIGATAEVTET